VGMLSVSVVGLVLNCTSVVVFSRQSRHRTFHLLLLTLAIVDSVYLVCLVTTFSLPIVSEVYFRELFVHIAPWSLPIAQVSQMASVYLTMALTLERYLVVCKPFKYIQLESITMFFKLAASAILFATVFNVPHFFHHYTDVKLENKTTGNITEEVLRPCIGTAEIRKNPLYIKIYVAWLNLIFSVIIPFLSLFFLNFHICRILMQQNGILRRTGENSLRRRERRLVMTCLAIVVVFLSCHTLKMILNIIEVYYIDFKKIDEALSGWGDILINISHFFLTLNSSINYIIYRVGSGKKSSSDGISVSTTRFSTKSFRSEVGRNKADYFEGSEVINKSERPIIVLPSLEQGLVPLMEQEELGSHASITSSSAIAREMETFAAVNNIEEAKDPWDSKQQNYVL